MTDDQQWPCWAVASAYPSVIKAWLGIAPAVKDWFFPPAAFALKHADIARGRAREAASAARAAANTYPSDEIDALLQITSKFAKGSASVVDGGRIWGKAGDRYLKLVRDDGSISEGEFKDGRLDGLACDTEAGDRKYRRCGRFAKGQIIGTSQRTNFEDTTMIQRVT
jgi:hypothetical protein